MTSEEGWLARVATPFFGKVPKVRRFDRPDGSLMHAEVRIDDSVIMLSEAMPDYPPNTTVLHVYVADVEAVYQRALDAGGQYAQHDEGKESLESRAVAVALPRQDGVEGQGRHHPLEEENKGGGGLENNALDFRAGNVLFGEKRRFRPERAAVRKFP